MKEKINTKEQLKNSFKFSIFDIALMGIMMSIYFVVVFIFKNFLPGKLNISIEILFYILFGIIFGPIKGSIFAILCDTVSQLFLGSIAFWMIEYAIVPPLISILSWALLFFYEKKNKFRFVFPLTILSLTIIGVIIFFVYQFIQNSFKFENSVMDPKLVFGLMIVLCILLILSIIITLTLYRIKKNELFIKVLYLIGVVSVVLIIFRWFWGPFAYVNFFNRFLANDSIPDKVMATQYPITLAGIAMKTSFVLPIFVIILIPTISAISVSKKNYFSNRSY